MVDVPAYYVGITISYSQVCGHSFKVAYIFHGLYYAILDVFTQGIAFATHGFKPGIEHFIQANKEIIAPASKPGNPFSVLNRGVKDISMEEPGLFTVLNLKPVY